MLRVVAAGVCVLTAQAAAGPTRLSTDTARERPYDQRVDAPFVRDTELRFTSDELAARGATDLASALALIPDVTVRTTGRGSLVAEIRGARQGAVAIVIDGIAVTDPYDGTFDVGSLPVTDIAEIRISTNPQSPIDGGGGSGGMIEVVTRDGVGPQLVIARALADSLPSFGITGTARAPLTRHLGLRISASGDAAPDDRVHAAGGATRLEYRKHGRRIVADALVDDRHSVAPELGSGRSRIVAIDRDTSARASVKVDERIGTLQLQGSYWGQYHRRKTRDFADLQLDDQLAKENLFELRSGGHLLATRPYNKRLRWLTSVVIEHAKALVFDANDHYVRGGASLFELAAGGSYSAPRWHADLAGGLAAPFGVDAKAWPEAKLDVTHLVGAGLFVTATGAAKGRSPSLRERLDPATGNPALGAERTMHAELRASEQRDRFRIDVAPFVRRTTDAIAISADPMTAGHLVNLRTLGAYGIDVQSTATVHPKLELGASYDFVRLTGDDALDRLPRHRFDGWARVLATAQVAAFVRVAYAGASRDGLTTIDGHTLVEASVNAQLTREVLAVLRIANALDVDAERQLDGRAVGRVLSVVVQGAWR